MTSWNKGVVAKMIINKTKGVAFIISNHALEKLPMTSWNCQSLPGVANDILEHRCTGQVDHKKENKQTVLPSRGLIVIDMQERNLRLTTVKSKQNKKTCKQY